LNNARLKHSFELRLGAIVHDNDLSPSSNALQRSDDLLDLPFSISLEEKAGPCLAETSAVLIQAKPVKLF